MNDPLHHRYDVTVMVMAVKKDGSPFPGPAEFAAAAERAASVRGASGIMSAHTYEKIISIVTVTAASRPTALAVALAVVSDALGHPAVPARLETSPG
jgi:hypothetical protein